MMRSNSSNPTFEHYLRTGEWLSESDWLDRHEQKFNPYHDPDDGRFTFAPGGPRQNLGVKPAIPARQRQVVRRPAAPAPQPIKRPQVRPIPGYPETGNDAWRKANDAIFERAADNFNATNRLKSGDARYMDPHLMKAWAMFESGGKKEAFLSDPFQVNVGDWDDEKLKLGLVRGKVPGPELSAYAGLRWLDKKGHLTIAPKDKPKITKYINLPFALMRYNGNNKIDSNGKPHKHNYVYGIYLLYNK